MSELNEQLGKRRRKPREEIRREIREFIRRNNIADPDILAALAESWGIAPAELDGLKGR